MLGQVKEQKNSPKTISREDVLNAFRARFGGEPDFLVRTPGRVNLIGEHTDYNDGFVFPMAIDRAVWMGVRARQNGEMRVYSVDYSDECCCDLNEELKKNQATWFEYMKGCAWALRRSGRPPQGFDGVLMGDLPQGAGLSSSAALEVSVLLAFDELGRCGLPGIEIAKLGQIAENEWVGMKCGIMDQTICALGQAGKALLIDCRDLDHESFDLPGGMVVAILDTATRHTFHNVTKSPYNERREQCEAACKILGVPQLRDATQEMLDAHKDGMPELVYRRARHILSENLRTRAAAEALRARDAGDFARLMNESHLSLQYDYEVSCLELDAITTIARRHPACLGARMTGGGFGGSAVALLYAEMGNFADYVMKRYREQVGKFSKITICRATDGGRVERLAGAKD